MASTPLLRSRLVTTGYGHWGMGWAETRNDREAGLQLDILDGKTRRVVWSGLAGGGFQGRMSPEEAEAKVAEAVRGLLAGFPPQPGRR